MKVYHSWLQRSLKRLKLLFYISNPVEKPGLTKEQMEYYQTKTRGEY